MPINEWMKASQTAAIVGVCKNAGKTTLLNKLINSDPHHRYGILSTGIDGEDFDLIYKNPKPKVNIPPKCLFITDQVTASELGSRIELITPAAGSNPRRRLWLCNSLVDLETQISGPASVADQLKSIEQLRKHNAEKIIIDGSLDRKSIVLSDQIDSVFLVASAGYGKSNELIAELTRLFTLSEIPLLKGISLPNKQYLLHCDVIAYKQANKWVQTTIQTLHGNEDQIKDLLALNPIPELIYIPGAITDSSFSKLINSGLENKLLLRHPEILKLKPNHLNTLVKKGGVSCMIPFRIKAVAVNSWSYLGVQPDADKFRTDLKLAFPSIEFTDLMEY